jgi:hypothetical protein
MPNWCSVSFDVYGTAEDLTRFREFVAGNDHEHPTAFDFNKLIPMPTELKAVCTYSSTQRGLSHSR